MRRKLFSNPKSSDTLKTAIITALITAAFTILASFGSVILQNYIASNIGREDALRSIRRETYLDYTANLNSYRYKSADFKECLVKQSKTFNIDISNDDAYDALATIGMSSCSGSTYVNSRFDYQESINRMHLDGSSEAVHLIKKIAAYVPSSIGSLTDENGLPPMSEILAYDNSIDSELYEKFLDQMCRDIRPTDKNVCEEFSADKE